MSNRTVQFRTLRQPLAKRIAHLGHRRRRVAHLLEGRDVVLASCATEYDGCRCWVVMLQLVLEESKNIRGPIDVTVDNTGEAALGCLIDTCTTRRGGGEEGP